MSNNSLIQLPVVIDLFSGCGGLSLGFQAAGFEIYRGIDICESAVHTASYNLHWRYGRDNKYICGDIRQLNSKIFYNEKIINKGCAVIGGPPCQAYSQIGKAKLRSLGKDRINTRDERGYLFQDFIRFALDLEARLILMENVPEATDYGGLNVPQHVCDILEENGYNAFWTILNSADYGVPQIRERVFVIAIRDDINISLPIPTHRSTENKPTPLQLRMKKFSKYKNFKEPNEAPADRPFWITTGEALSDLPSLFASSKSEYQLYKPNIQLNYKSKPLNPYQELMRNWYGYNSKSVTGHGYRRTARDFQIFERMKQGDDYRAAVDIAEDLLKEFCRIENICKNKNPIEYEKLRKKIVPPYDTNKFSSKWKKLSEDKPSHTLVAHLSTDTYSHLHPWEPRGISVREAARLQSFPDGFLFQCSMSDAFKQIGNAVPPLLSKAIAETIKRNLISRCI